MFVHIAIMSVLAPLLAMVFAPQSSQARALWAATAVQVLMLWIVHVPVVSAMIQTSSSNMSVALALLLLVAVWFWREILAGAQSWRAIAALLLTGKLTCLIAALLVFSPRAIYDAHGHHTGAGLADQQLAGLVMVTACPLSYLVAALILAGQLVFPVPPVQERPAGTTS